MSALRRLGNLSRKLRSRSGSELRFRLGQELTNFRLFAFPPTLGAAGLQPSGQALIPDPADVANRLRPTPFAAECIRLADQILQHRFPLLGGVLDTGPTIHWRRDYLSGLETGTAYFRRIPYLDATRAGDHKNIWELNRHQHLVLLAQAYLFSNRPEFFEEIVSQLESWLEQNPFQRGMNWTSALEVAFRALSWIWVYRLVGDHFSDPFRRRFLAALHWHGLHLQANLSHYFSPNTHLLGEAVALHALGCLFPGFPEAKQWEKTGAAVVRNQLDHQVFADGCHFELSLYYHVYALDMFLFHAILRGLDEVWRNKLARMAEFLDCMLGPSGILPLIGDDDGGRFFHPYGPRNQFALATLATCGVFLDRPQWIRNAIYLQEQASWWLPCKTDLSLSPPAQPASVHFPDSGLVVMSAGDLQIIVDAGPFGPGNAGHTHADTLSLLLRQGAEQILVDPGAYTYVGDPVWRNRFRGTAAHNTVRIDGMDQAIPGGPFAWRSRPGVEVLAWESSPARDILTAACSYAGLRHQRTVVFDKSALRVVILDRLEAEGEHAEGEHQIEQFWHFGTEVRQLSPCCFQAGSKVLVAFEETAASKTAVPRLSEGGDYGWISPAFGVKLPAPVVLVERRTTFPATLATLLDLSGKALSGKARTLRFRLNADHSAAECTYDEEPATCVPIPIL
jgi:hypothetical protein